MRTATPSALVNRSSENNTWLSRRRAAEHPVFWSNSRLKATERQPPSLGGAGGADREERWHHPQTIAHKTDTRSKLVFRELPGQMEARRQVHSAGEMTVKTWRHNSSVALIQKPISARTNYLWSGAKINSRQLLHNSALRWDCPLAQKHWIRTLIVKCLFHVVAAESDQELLLAVWTAAFVAN